MSSDASRTINTVSTRCRHYNLAERPVCAHRTARRRRRHAAYAPNKLSNRDGDVQLHVLDDRCANGARAVRTKVCRRRFLGSADLQICLLDQALQLFNCTGLLDINVQPGKVALKIPPVGHPFHVRSRVEATTAAAATAIAMRSLACRSPLFRPHKAAR